MIIFGSVIVIIIIILIRTGSFGKAFSFFMAYLFYPGIFALLGGFVFKALDESYVIGSMIGGIVGAVLAFRKGFKNMK